MIERGQIPSNVPTTADAPLLLGRTQLARTLSLSPATVDRLAAEGQLPVGVKLGVRRLWSREIIVRWIAAGCPERETWEKIEAARLNGPALPAQSTPRPKNVSPRLRTWKENRKEPTDERSEEAAV